MRRTVTAVTVAIGLAFASLTGTAATAFAKPAPVAVSHQEHMEAAVASVDAFQIPAHVRSIPAKLGTDKSFQELKHPWYNLVRRPRLEAQRAAQRAAAAKAAAQRAASHHSASGLGVVSLASYGSFQACVIKAESGGNPNAQNPISTASGLYGFLDTTWTSITGLPGPARNYSVAQQNAAFAKLYAEDGTAPWAPYDGC